MAYFAPLKEPFFLNNQVISRPWQNWFQRFQDFPPLEGANIITVNHPKYGTVDDSLDVQRAIDELSARGGGTLFFGNDTYYCAGGLTWASNVNAIWNDTTILSANANKCINISGCSNVTWLGKVNLMGESPGASNKTYGLYANSAFSNFHAQHIHVEDVSMGILLSYATDCVFDIITAIDVRGLYVNGDGAGDVFAITDSSRISVGIIESYNCWKCCCYLGTSGVGNNSNINIGKVNNLAPSGADDGNTVGLRSASGVTIGQINAFGGIRGLLIQNYSGDTATYAKLEDINIGVVRASGISETGGDGVVVDCVATSTANRINIGSVIVDGADLIGFYANNITDLHVGQLTIYNVGGHGVDINDCDNVVIDSLIERNIGTAITNTYDGINIDADCSNVVVGEQRIYVDGVSNYHRYAFRFEGEDDDGYVNDVRSSSHATAVGFMRASTFTRVNAGRIYKAAAPSSGTWAVGDIVWNEAPVAEGAPGWICVTAGTPGTWKAMANLAA